MMDGLFAFSTVDCVKSSVHTSRLCLPRYACCDSHQLITVVCVMGGSVVTTTP